MENLSYSSYPESGDSSPLTREIDENQSWEESQQPNYKVKLMCSYGGKIQPRPHDNQLSYVGGDTKILAVERNVKFSVIINKLTSLSGDADICIKYQLPGEDLDALISVTNDEDLEHMMLEYDRLFRASVKPARLRIFLFHLNPPPSTTFGSSDDANNKADRQWYVNALNAVPVQNPEGSSPPAGNPDFLFRLDKRTVPITKYMDTAPAQPTVPEIIGSVGSDGSEDRFLVGDAMVSQQISDLQRLQISAANEQVLNRKLIEEASNKAYGIEQYQQKVEKVSPSPPPPAQVSMQMMMPPGTYMPERQMTYAISTPQLNEQTFYQQVPTASGGGAYQAQTMRTMTGPGGQGYYEVYKEQQMYNPVPVPAATGSIPQNQNQNQKIGVYNDGMGMVQTKVGVAEQGYMQVSYDSAGRQVYYTVPYQPQSQATGQSPVQVVMAPQTSSG